MRNLLIELMSCIIGFNLMTSCGPSKAEIEAKMRLNSDTSFIREIAQRQIEIPDHCNICYHVILVGEDTILVSYARSSGTTSSVKLSK